MLPLSMYRKYFAAWHFLQITRESGGIVCEYHAHRAVRMPYLSEISSRTRFGANKHAIHTLSIPGVFPSFHNSGAACQSVKMHFTYLYLICLSKLIFGLFIYNEHVRHNQK